MIKLTKKQALTYKQQWKNVESAQIRELRATPMPLKFKQLCFLMNSFPLRSSDRNGEKEENKVRERWMKLKKRQDNGRA